MEKKHSNISSKNILFPTRPNFDPDRSGLNGDNFQNRFLVQNKENENTEKLPLSLTDDN